MKKIYSILALVALISVSCAREELVQPSAKEGEYMTLEGTIQPDTRIAVGELSGNKYPVLWTADDAIGVFSSEANIDNVAARIHNSSVGQNVGKFTTSDPVDYPAASTELLIYYPYNDYASVDGPKLSSAIPSEQVHGAANSSEHIGQYTVAYGTASVSAEAPTVTFALNHAAAYVRVVLTTSEFNGYKLKGVVLRDLSNSKPLSGSVSVNLETGALTVAEPNAYYVRTEFAEPHVLGSSAAEIWLTAIPADFSSTPLYVAVEMESPDGATVTVPVKVNGNLKADAVNTIEVSSLSLSSNVLSWYEPTETRKLVGGWAYGESNCFIIQAGVIGSGVNQKVAVKARGHFGKVNEPKYVALVVGNNCNEKQSNSKFYINDDNTIAQYSSSLIITAYKQLGTDCDFNVKTETNTFSDGKTLNYKGLAVGKVVVCDKDKNILWTTSLWGRTAADVPSVTMKCGAEVMYCNLGALNSNTDDWKNGGAFYQWGRPVPFSWSGKMDIPSGVHAVTMSEADAVTGVYADMITMAMTHPQEKYSPQGNFANARGDWHIGTGTGELSDRRQDLWGNPDCEPNGGHKTIYDPCPKGWRVITPAVVEELNDAVATMGKEAATMELHKTNNSDKVEKMFYLKYNVSSDNSLYFPLSGCIFLAKWSGNLQFMVRPYSADDGNIQRMSFCWANAPAGPTSHDAYAFGFTNPDKRITGDEQEKNVRPTADFMDNMGGRANGFPVRCMKDTENR